jgi:hypothetical protein
MVLTVKKRNAWSEPRDGSPGEHEFLERCVPYAYASRPDNVRRNGGETSSALDRAE